MKCACFLAVVSLFGWRYVNAPENWDLMKPNVVASIAFLTVCADASGITYVYGMLCLMPAGSYKES